MSELESHDQIPAETAPVETPAPAAVEAPAPAVETPAPAAETPAPAAEAAPEAKPAPRPRPERGPRPERKERGENRGERGDRPPRGDRPQQQQGQGRPGGDRRPPREGGKFGPPREPQADMDVDKLIADSLYLDNQAHAIVARMRDMDSGTRSQLRRFYSAVRRACRTADAERQHQFVMLRARLAYTIARHQLRSLDPLERLLLQVTRKNDAKGYERFRDLFEAIVAYNE